jgi:2-hydroxycyclohexanecarboxyl-CoA dehydrogenase
MDLGLAGQTAVVFGAARGLGYAIAAGFAAEGVRVRLVDASPAVIDAASQLLDTQADVLDVTDAVAVRAFAERTPADHLAFAVGIGSGQFGFPFWNVDPSAWDRVLRVNLTGAAAVACAFGPRMAEAGRGTMVFLSSVAGQIGSQTDPPYSAAKAGLINFAQCAAKDLAPFGVRVNTICPGMVQTPLNRSVWQAWADRQPPETWQSYEDWTAEKIRKVVPLNRWQTPDDVAAMAVFLASPRAGNVTGQTINVDGGFVMHW